MEHARSLNGAARVPTAIVIGASTGIGREIALQLRSRGFRLGLASRDDIRLNELSESMGAEHCIVRAMDISQSDQTREGFGQLCQNLGAIDFVYLVAGTGFLNEDLQSSLEEQTLAVNCLGFATVAVAAAHLFRMQERGHLVAITSVAAVRASGDAPAYGASKAFGSSYIDALRYWAARRRLAMIFTEVRLGFVDTTMMKVKHPIWVISPAEAAARIIKAVDRRRKLVYIPRRWWFVAQIMKVMPDWMYTKLM